MSNRPRNMRPKTVFCFHFVDVFVLDLLNAITCRTFFMLRKRK
jgi:hypothetical protein